MSSVETLVNELQTEMIREYSYEDLLTFTSNFEIKVGGGGFSNAYLGRFSDGVRIVVKVLMMHDDVDDLFETEVGTLGTIYHRSLVKLYGFCSDDNMKALVYEYVENGSLDRILYRNFSNLPLNLVYNIMVEIAKALAYLHHGCIVQIIHRDLNPSNVLIDNNFSAKLIEFGVENFMDENDKITYVRGTTGYVAPEVLSTDSSVTYKSNVYSFGMILLDVLDRKPSYSRDIEFLERVWENCRSRNLEKTIADCGIKDGDRKKATVLAMVALWCVQFTPESRPSMSTVVTILEQEMYVNTPPYPFSPSGPATSMQPDMNYSPLHSSISESVDTQQIPSNSEEQATDLMTDRDGRNSTEIQPAGNISKEQDLQLMPDIQAIRDIGDGKKLGMFLAYVENKRLVTNEVCESILKKFEELQTECSTYGDDQKMKELRTYVEMKQSVTNEMCEGILRKSKEV